jgi:hypothetical protein
MAALVEFSAYAVRALAEDVAQLGGDLHQFDAPIALPPP